MACYLKKMCFVSSGLKLASAAQETQRTEVEEKAGSVKLPSWRYYRQASAVLPLVVPKLQTRSRRELPPSPSGTTARCQVPVVPLEVPARYRRRPENLLYSLSVPGQFLPRSTAGDRLRAGPSGTTAGPPVLPPLFQQRYYRRATGTTAACVQKREYSL